MYKVKKIADASLLQVERTLVVIEPRNWLSKGTKQVSEIRDKVRELETGEQSNL